MSSYDRLWKDWLAIFGLAFFNLEQDRGYSASASNNEKQLLGFTEVWGVDPATASDDEFLLDTATSDQIPSTSAQDSSELVLLQHRPAWAEQLVLRVAGIQHVVKNLPYTCTEITGPLPCLVDSKDTTRPVLVGKKQMGSLDTILSYLKDSRAIDIKAPADMKNQSMLLTRILLDTLPLCLTVLRYKDDHAWYQVNRSQCLQSYAGGNPSLISGLFQTWGERHFALCALPRQAARWDVATALRHAKDAYQLLEEQIQSTKSGFLFGDKITVVDALLFDHLLQALADVHLVMALSSYSGLCRYTEQLWDIFVKSEEEWIIENDFANAKNPFSRIPLVQTESDKLPETFTNALQVMQGLAVGQESLQQRLSLLAQREREANPQQQAKTAVNPGTTTAVNGYGYLIERFYLTRT